MTAPAKLPAYGNPLLRSRRAGVHPAVVTVVYGESWDWDVPGSEFVAVKPGDALGRDWRCVAGLPVTVINGVAGTLFGLHENNEFLMLLGEIAREAARITVWIGGELRIPADVLAFLCRRYDEPARRMVWPAWWSDEIEKLNRDNIDAARMVAPCKA